MGKEENEIVQRLGKEWGNWWISDGIEVYHRSSVTADLTLRKNAVVMIVDRVLKKQVNSNTKSKPFHIKGIACHWYQAGDYKKGVFHTKELLPATVVEQGPDTLADWLERKGK